MSHTLQQLMCSKVEFGLSGCSWQRENMSAGFYLSVLLTLNTPFMLEDQKKKTQYQYISVVNKSFSHVFFFKAPQIFVLIQILFAWQKHYERLLCWPINEKWLSLKQTLWCAPPTHLRWYFHILLHSCTRCQAKVRKIFKSLKWRMAFETDPRRASEPQTFYPPRNWKLFFFFPFFLPLFFCWAGDGSWWHWGSRWDLRPTRGNVLTDVASALWSQTSGVRSNVQWWQMAFSFRFWDSVASRFSVYQTGCNSAEEQNSHLNRMKADRYKQQPHMTSVSRSWDTKTRPRPEECGSSEGLWFTSCVWILSVSPLYLKSRKVPVNSRGRTHPSWNTTEEAEEPSMFTHIFAALMHNVPYCSFKVAWRIKLTVLQVSIHNRCSCGAAKGRKIRTSFEISVYCNCGN